MAALMLVGCKPTEGNYRSAYDAAKARREAAAREQMRPATGLQSDDGPQRKIIDGDTVYVLRDRLWLAQEGNVRLQARWGVAVGMFKMDTNAKAGAANLAEQGWDGAQAVRAQNAVHYTLADTAASLDDAIRISKTFRARFPDYPYVGLPGAPVLISN